MGRSVDIIGVGFVEGLPGLYANCTVWLNDDDTVAGVTPLGHALGALSIVRETSESETSLPAEVQSEPVASPEPEPEPASTVVEPAPISLLNMGS